MMNLLSTTKKTTVKIGNEQIEVKPLTLENSLRLVLLLAPYISKIEDKWPRLQEALRATDGARPHLLELLFVEWRQELAFMPGDIVTAFSLCLNVETEFIAKNAKAEDLVTALPVLNEINDFPALYAAVRELGITGKYA